MNYTKFVRWINEKICDTEMQSVSSYRRHSIALSTSGTVFIDGKKTELKGLEEARQHIDAQIFQKRIIKELYEETPTNKIAKIIREHNEEVKITDTIIESYVDLASSKSFSIDPIVSEIRALSVFDTLVENRIDYILEDGNVVAIEHETQEMLNNLLEGSDDVVSFMRQNKNNFIQVISKIKESEWQS